MTLIRKFAKHVLGRDLWIRPDVNVGASVLGSSYGGWGVVLGKIAEDAVVYSFGIGEDASFDLALIEAKGCEVQGFDPTPKSLNWVEQHVDEPKFVIRPWALGGEDGELELWLPDNPDHVSASLRPSAGLAERSFKAECFTLKSVMERLGHRRVDILKMDIEGAEYPAIRCMVNDRSIERVDQLMIEFHHWLPSFSLDDTRNCIAALRAEGYRIGWVSESCHEVLFVR